LYFLFVGGVSSYMFRNLSIQTPVITRRDGVAIAVAWDM